MKKYFSICLVLAIFNFFSYRALAAGKKGKKKKDYVLFTPEFLLTAVENGNVDLVEKILKSQQSKKGNFVNHIASPKENPYTPLTVAIKKLNDDMVIMLLRHVANPNELFILTLGNFEITRLTPYQMLKKNLNN